MLAAIRGGRHETLLIHGVTGSGKTEVYIHAIQEVVRFGRQAIVLVPEISLTPQTGQRFRARFGAVAVLHSHLTRRRAALRIGSAIARGEVPVVVGARSAIFAPMPHLGLDRARTKSTNRRSSRTRTPRYHARDVALLPRQAENVPLVLGSATPSLESWHRARRGDIPSCIEMPRRVFDRPCPRSLRSTCGPNSATGAVAARSAGNCIARCEAALADGGQVILLLNRRGFSTHIQCPACGDGRALPALRHRPDASPARRAWRFVIIATIEMPAPSQCPECTFTGDPATAASARNGWKRRSRARFPQARTSADGHRHDAIARQP